MKIKVLDFQNKEHFNFLNYLINYNSIEFLNDNLDGQTLINLLSGGDYPVFIVYVKNQPYGIIYAELSTCKIATLHACCGKERNYFINVNIMKKFLQYLFETLKLAKVKIEILVYDKNAEFLARSLGFRKEGVLREEVYKKGKAQNMILLALTKKDYFAGKHILKRKDIKRIGELIRYGEK